MNGFGSFTQSRKVAKNAKIRKKKVYRLRIDFQNEQNCFEQLDEATISGAFEFCISVTEKNLQAISFLTFAALRLCVRSALGSLLAYFGSSLKPEAWCPSNLTATGAA